MRLAERTHVSCVLADFQAQGRAKVFELLLGGFDLAIFGGDMPVGSQRSIQGTGDGTFHMFLSGGAQICCRGHWISNTGVVVPTDDDDESELFYWSNHFDYYLGRGWYSFTEFNWYNYLASGDRLQVGWEGGDLYNIGAADVTGNDVVTGAFGLKYKPSCNSEIGVAWEVPLTDRRDVLENRITFDWIVRY